MNENPFDNLSNDEIKDLQAKFSKNLRKFSEDMFMLTFDHPEELDHLKNINGISSPKDDI